MTRSELEKLVKERFEEAFAGNAVATEEACREIVGAEVFCYGALPTATLAALGRRLFTICLEARGV